MMLSTEQQVALDHVHQRRNVFITGPGGTGKSMWIRHLAATLPNVQVCALTGCAAVLLDCDARTLHGWAGIGLGHGNPKTSEFARHRWKSVQTLIVDEVSMMSRDLFDTLNQIGKDIRSCSLPFGGIQLVFCGDFYQLPPVNASFCFESVHWQTTFPLRIVFTQMFRQKSPVYQDILNSIRRGELSKEQEDILKTRILPPPDCVRLVPTRTKASAINKLEFDKLEGEARPFFAVTHGNPNDILVLKKNVICDLAIDLKVGTHVMCVVNLSPYVCNGTQGVVVRFTEGHPVVKFPHGEHTMFPHPFAYGHAKLYQIPLIYAWAVTIHKSQGATLQRAVIDIGEDIFECGQTYVALSRVVDLEGLFLVQFSAEHIKVNAKVKAFYN